MSTTSNSSQASASPGRWERVRAEAGASGTRACADVEKFARAFLLQARVARCCFPHACPEDDAAISVGSRYKNIVHA